MPNRIYFRASTSDTAPRVAHPQEALDITGQLLPEYYSNEAAAWGAILERAEFEAQNARTHYNLIEKALRDATNHLVRAQTHQHNSLSAYETWRRRLATVA